MATSRAPNGLGPPNPTKKLAHWVDLLGQPLSRNHVFEIFSLEPFFGGYFRVPLGGFNQWSNLKNGQFLKCNFEPTLFLTGIRYVHEGKLGGLGVVEGILCLKV